MKRYAKVLSPDKRGQVVIPKDVREELGITQETAFHLYVIEGEGVFLRQTNPEPLSETDAIDELKAHAERLGIPLDAIEDTLEDYKPDTGGLEDV